MSDVIDSDADITTSEAINQHAEAQQTSTNFPQHESSAPTGPTQARNRFSPSNLDGTTANWQRLLIEVRDFRHELIDATNKRIAYEKIMDEKRAEDALAAQETPAEKAIRETSDEPTVVDREEPIPLCVSPYLRLKLACCWSLYVADFIAALSISGCSQISPTSRNLSLSRASTTSPRKSFHSSGTKTTKLFTSRSRWSKISMTRPANLCQAATSVLLPTTTTWPSFAA